MLNKALASKCQHLSHEQRLHLAAEAQAVELRAQLAQLRAQVAELVEQRGANRAQFAALKQQLAGARRVNANNHCWLGHSRRTAVCSSCAVHRSKSGVKTTVLGPSGVCCVFECSWANCAAVGSQDCGVENAL
jgi:hypothetical protein